MSSRTFVLQKGTQQERQITLTQDGHGVRWSPSGQLAPGWKLDGYVDYISMMWGVLGISWLETTAESKDSGE